MGQAIGQVLSLGVGVALSPIPIVGVVLMLGTPAGRNNGPAFLAGWIGGLAVAGTIVLLISGGVFAALVAGIVVTPWPERAGTPRPDVTFELGRALMGPKMLVMMVLGVAILATMIASVLLATHRGRYDRYGDALDAGRPADPGGGDLA